MEWTREFTDGGIRVYMYTTFLPEPEKSGGRPWFLLTIIVVLKLPHPFFFIEKEWVGYK